MPRIDDPKTIRRTRRRAGPTPRPAPQTRRPEFTGRTPAVRVRVKRPAPAVQPGPFRASERKTVERHKRTKSYAKSIYKAQPVSKRRARIKAIEAKPPSRRTSADRAVLDTHRKRAARDRKLVSSQVMTDRQRRILEAFKETDTYADAIDVARKARISDDRPWYVTESDPDKLRAAGFTESKVEKAIETPVRASVSAVKAPVLKVLEQTTRPLHAIASAEVEALKAFKRGGQAEVFQSAPDVAKAAAQGAANKRRDTTADVLTEIGWKPQGRAGKIAKGVLSFAGDVAGDPLTYVTAGAGSVALRASSTAAKSTRKKAVKAGLTPAQADRLAAIAAKQAAKRAPRGRGITVRVAGKEVPGVRRGTAAATETGRRATRKVTRGRRSRRGAQVRDDLRTTANTFAPGVRPVGVSHAENEAIRSAARTARSTISRKTFKARQEARAIQEAIGEKNYAPVLDAIEARRVKDLPDELREPARFLQSRFKHDRHVERRAGVKVPERKGYVPHVHAESVAAGGARRGVGKRRVRPSFSKARQDPRTLAELRKAEPGEYVEDPGVLYAARGFESARAQAAANLNRRLADIGRTVKPGPLELGDREAIYHVRGSDIAKLDDKAASRFAAGEAPLTGRYVVLPEKAVDRALESVLPGMERHPVTLTFDRVQGGWKYLSTQVNPGFHVRNLAGDTMNAYLAQSAPRLAKSLGQSAQGLRMLSRQERQLKTLSGKRSVADRTLGRVLDPARRGIKVPGEGRVSYDQLVREAEEVGAVRAGFVGGELNDLLTDATKAARPSGKHRRVGRWLQNREDWARLATFIGARKGGFAPEAAATRAAKYHFDYRELSQFEQKIMRRVMPFYTFTARNVPLQMQSLLTRPGKFAQYQKLRENFAEAFGISLPEHEGKLAEYEQRAAGLPIKWKGVEFTLSLGPSGLPLTDLNELPVTGDPSKTADEWLSKAMSMVTPAIKSPVELWANFSFFFRDQIERDTGPLVPAPKIVQSLPKPIRDKLGVVPDYLDKRTGKRGWAWPAKVDYLSNTLSVGPAGFTKRVTTEDGRPGKSPGFKVAGYLGGRVVPVDATTTRINNLYDEREGVERQRSALNQRGQYSTNPTRAWRQVNDRYNRITDEIERLRGKRGDVAVVARRKSRRAASDSTAPLWGPGSRDDALIPPPGGEDDSAAAPLWGPDSRDDDTLIPPPDSSKVKGFW